MNFLKTDYAEILIKDGILFFTYLPIPTFDIQLAKQIVSDRLHIQREQAYPVLCDIRKFSLPDIKARKYLAIEGSLLTTAVAYLVAPALSVQLTQFFIRVNKPLVPTQVFTDKSEAIHYLKQF